MVLRVLGACCPGIALRNAPVGGCCAGASRVLRRSRSSPAILVESNSEEPRNDDRSLRPLLVLVLCFFVFSIFSDFSDFLGRLQPFKNYHPEDSRYSGSRRLEFSSESTTLLQ